MYWSYLFSECTSFLLKGKGVSKRLIYELNQLVTMKYSQIMLRWYIFVLFNLLSKGICDKTHAKIGQTFFFIVQNFILFFPLRFVLEFY